MNVKKTSKRVLSFVLVFMMVVSMFSGAGDVFSIYASANISHNDTTHTSSSSTGYATDFESLMDSETQRLMKSIYDDLEANPSYIAFADQREYISRGLHCHCVESIIGAKIGGNRMWPYVERAGARSPGQEGFPGGQTAGERKPGTKRRRGKAAGVHNHSF